MNTMSKAQEPGDIESLLPWHAVGTLNRRDAARVEEALAKDQELARRYELVREELGETIHLNETLGAPSARAAQKLFAAIDAEPRVARKSPGLGARFVEFFSARSPRTLAWAGTAAAALVVIQSGLLAGLYLDYTGGRFQATNEQGDTVTYRGIDLVMQADVLVSFNPAASTADVTKFLEANKATLVDGPKGGMFRIRLSGVRSKAELAKAVAQMQNERGVVNFVTSAE